MKKIPESVVDFHVHLFPDKGFDAIWKIFESAYNYPVLHRLYYRECVEYLRNRNVGTIVYSNYAHKKGIAQPMNQWNVQILEEIEDIYCFAAYHPDDDNAIKNIEEILSHPRVIGVKLHFLVQPVLPYDSRLYPLYELIMAKKKRLLFHCGTGPLDNKNVGFSHFNRLLEDFPELPVNIAHMGAFEYKQFMELLDDHPNLYLDTAYTFWNIPGSFDLGNEYLEKNRRRILYGSDFPNIILPREDEIKGLLERDLSQDFYDSIFYSNGMSLLKELSPARDGSGSTIA